MENWASTQLVHLQDEVNVTSVQTEIVDWPLQGENASFDCLFKPAQIKRSIYPQEVALI